MFDELLPIVRNVRRRMRKNMGGLYRTKTRQPGAYNKNSYWDERFYTTIRSDDDTNLGFNQPLITAYHYASLEAAVILALSKCNKQSAEVLLDIGSGTGHWTDFFMKTYPKLKKRFYVMYLQRASVICKKNTQTSCESPFTMCRLKMLSTKVSTTSFVLSAALFIL